LTCWTDGFAEAVAGDIGGRRRRSVISACRCSPCQDRPSK
jgi:hypothetical protein